MGVLTAVVEGVVGALVGALTQQTFAKHLP